jgi:hypothetical protein
MNCDQLKELIPLFPDDLDLSEAEAVRSHVAGCTPCAAELGIYMAQAARFATLRQNRDKVDLLAGIEERLAQPANAGRITRFPFAAKALFAAAAAGVVIFFGLSAFSSHKTETPREQPSPIAQTPKGNVPGAQTVSGGNLAGQPQHQRGNHRPHRRIFEPGEGVTPNGLQNVGERELIPLDEEAEIPQARKKTFAEPPAAHPNTSPKAGDEDRSLSF